MHEKMTENTLRIERVLFIIHNLSYTRKRKVKQYNIERHTNTTQIF